MSPRLSVAALGGGNYALGRMEPRGSRAQVASGGFVRVSTGRPRAGGK